MKPMSYPQRQRLPMIRAAHLTRAHVRASVKNVPGALSVPGRKHLRALLFHVTVPVRLRDNDLSVFILLKGGEASSTSGNRAAEPKKPKLVKGAPAQPTNRPLGGEMGWLVNQFTLPVRKTGATPVAKWVGKAHTLEVCACVRPVALL